MPSKADDFLLASEICKKYKNLECLQAAAELMHTFRDSATVLFACTLDRALRPFISHIDQPDDVISETGNHFAVLLHDRVFDNHHPEGERLERWMKNYEYAQKDCSSAHFTDDVIARLSYEEMRRYLKKSKRSPLGQPWKPRKLSIAASGASQETPPN